MAWLGEEMGEKAEGALAPRCVKDVVEEKLFEKRRDLFCDLSAVFMDTTSLSFYGEGGETLGERGYSKDYRPDLAQMILALIVDGKGRPICTEMWPGNTADVTTLLPVVDRLRRRFAIGRVCVVADRGMISGATIEGLEARGLDYILGARERSDATVKKIVLENDAPFTPLFIERRAARRSSSSRRSRSTASATSSAATKPKPRRIGRTGRRSSPRSTRNCKRATRRSSAIPPIAAICARPKRQIILVILVE